MDGFDVKQSIAGANIRAMTGTSTQFATAVNVTNRSQTNTTIVETGSVRYKSAALDAVTQVELIYGKADADLEMQVGAIRTRPLASADTAESFILDQGAVHAGDGVRGILPHDFVLSSMLYNVPHGATVGNVAFGTLSTAGAALMDTFAVEARSFGTSGDGRTAVRVRDLSGIDNLDDTYSLVASNASGQLRFKQITNAFKSDVDLRVPITVAGLASGYTDAYIEHEGARVLDFDTLFADENAFVMDVAKLQTVRAAAGNSVVTFYVTNGLSARSFPFRILDGPFYRVHGEGAVVDAVPKVFIDLVDGYAHHVTAPFDRSIDYPGYALRLLNNIDADGQQGSMITSMQFTGINADGSNAAPVAVVVGDNYADPTFEMDATLQAPTSDRVVSTGRLRIQLADESSYITTAADVRPKYARFIESLYSGGSYVVSGNVASHIAGSNIIQFDSDSAMSSALAAGHVLTIGTHGAFTVMHVSEGGDVTLSTTVAADLTNVSASMRLGLGDFVVNSGSLKTDVFNMAPTDRYMTLDGNLRVGAVRGTFINSRTLSVGGSAPGDSGLFVRQGNAFINVTGTTDIASTTFRVGPRDTDDVPHFWLMANGARSSLRAPGDMDISSSANATVEATRNLHLYGDDAIYVTSSGVLDVAAGHTDARYATTASLSVGGLHAIQAGSANTVVLADARTSVGGVHAISVGGDAIRVVAGADTTIVAGAISLTSANALRVQSANNTTLSVGDELMCTVVGNAHIDAGASIVHVAAAGVTVSAGGAFSALAHDAVALTSATSTLGLSAAQTVVLSAGTGVVITTPQQITIASDSLAVSVGNAIVVSVGAGGFGLTVGGALGTTVGGHAAISVADGLDVSVNGATTLTVANGPLVLSTSGSIFAHTATDLVATVEGGLVVSVVGAAQVRAASLAASVVDAAQLTVGGALDVSVAGDVRVFTAGTVHASTGGAFLVGAMGHVDVTVGQDASLSVAGNAVVTVAHNLNTSATVMELSVSDEMLLTAQTGGITLSSNDAFIVVDGNLRLNGLNSMQTYGDDWTVSVGGLVSLASVGRTLVATSSTMDLSADGALALSTGAGFKLNAVGHALVSIGGDIDVRGTEVRVRAGASLTTEAVANVTVRSGAALAVAVVEDATLSVGGALVAASGTYMRATVAQTVDLSAGGNVHLRSDRSLILDATDAVIVQTAGDGQVDVGGNLRLSVGESAAVAVGGAAQVAVGETLSVGSIASMTVSTGSSLRMHSATTTDLAAVGAASLSTGAGLALTGATAASISTGGALVLSAVSDARVQSGANVVVRADENIELSAFAYAQVDAGMLAVDIDADARISAGGALTLTAQSGNISIASGASALVSAVDAYALSAAKISEVAGVGGWQVSSAASASLSAVGAIVIQTPLDMGIVTGGTTTIDAGADAVVVAANDAVLSIGGEIEMLAGGNVHISAADQLRVEADSIRATFTHDTDVSVGGTANVVVLGAVHLASARLGVVVLGATELSVGTHASVTVGGSTSVVTVGSTTLTSQGVITLRTADALVLSVNGDAEIAVLGDIDCSTNAGLLLTVGADADATVARNLTLSVGGEFVFDGDGNATVYVGGETDVSVGGSVAIAVAGALDMAVGSAIAMRSANVSLVCTDMTRGNAISVAGSMDVRVSGAMLAISVAGAAQTNVGTHYALHALQGSLSLGAAATTTLSTGANLHLGAADEISVSAGESIYVTSGALIDVVAARLDIDLSSNAVVHASDATVVLSGGDFTLSTSAGVRMTALRTINMVAPDGLVVDALDGLSMGSAVGGAGNVVLSRTDGLVAATTAANIHIYSTAVDGPSLRLDDHGGVVRVANQHTFEVTGASGRFDVSVNSAYFTNDLIVRGDLRVLGDQVIEGGTVQLQTRDLNIEDKSIELAVIVQDAANTVVAVAPISAIGDFSLSADLTTLSFDLTKEIHFPTGGAWPWFRPYDAANAPAGSGAYIASLVPADFDVTGAYANRELFIRTEGHQDLANSVIYDSFVTHARFERAYAVPEGNIVLLRTSGSVVQPDGANVDVYSNAFLYGLNGDYTTPTWANDAATGTFTAKAPSMAIKYYSDTMADQGGIKLRANKLESVMWYKANGSQTRPYWRVTSDLFIGDKNAFHFAAPGTEDSAHWFMFVDTTTGSLVYAFGTVQSYLIASALDRPMAI